MKKIVLLGLWLNLLLMSCNKEVAPPCEVTQKLENTRDEAKSFLVGKWKLIDYFAFRAQQVDPNLQLKIKEGGITDQYSVEIYEDNKSIGTLTFTVVEGMDENKTTILNIDSPAKILNNGRDNIMHGEMRICENQLLLDHGMKFDAPGFLFEKE